MSEFSAHWTTGAGSGDSQVSYTQAQNSTIQRVLAAAAGFEGVAAGYLNSMAGTVTGANTVAINTGGAVVDGKAYENSASVNVNIPSAVGGGNTRIDRIVLRASWAAYTVRITRIAGTDAASPTAPAITQTAGTTYDIMLYQALVNTAGAVTLTDERVYAKVATGGITDLAVTAAKIAADAVTTSKILDANVTLAKMAANSVDSDQYVDGSVDYEHLSNGASKVVRRMGNSATNWAGSGSTTYTPTNAMIQCGSVIDGSPVTFPVAFAYTPVVLLTCRVAGHFASVDLMGVAADHFHYTTWTDSGAAAPGDEVFWLAIGPSA